MESPTGGEERAIEGEYSETNQLGEEEQGEEIIDREKDTTSASCTSDIPQDGENNE